MVLRWTRQAVWVLAWLTLLVYLSVFGAALPHHTLYTAAFFPTARTWLLVSFVCVILNGFLYLRARVPLPGGFMQISTYLMLVWLVTQIAYISNVLTTGDWGDLFICVAIDLYVVWGIRNSLRSMRSVSRR